LGCSVSHSGKGRAYLVRVDARCRQKGPTKKAAAALDEPSPAREKRHRRVNGRCIGEIGGVYECAPFLFFLPAQVETEQEEDGRNRAGAAAAKAMRFPKHGLIGAWAEISPTAAQRQNMFLSPPRPTAQRASAALPSSLANLIHASRDHLGGGRNPPPPFLALLLLIALLPLLSWPSSSATRLAWFRDSRRLGSIPPLVWNPT